METQKESGEESYSFKIYQAMLLHSFSLIVEQDYETVKARFDTLTGVFRKSCFEHMIQVCNWKSVSVTLDPKGEFKTYLEFLDQQEGKPPSKLILIKC